MLELLLSIEEESNAFEDYFTCCFRRHTTELFTIPSVNRNGIWIFLNMWFMNNRNKLYFLF